MPSLAFIASPLRDTDENFLFEMDLSGTILFLLNVFTALKGTIVFIFLFKLFKILTSSPTTLRMDPDIEISKTGFSTTTLFSICGIQKK